MDVGELAAHEGGEDAAAAVGGPHADPGDPGDRARTSREGHVQGVGGGGADHAVAVRGDEDAIVFGDRVFAFGLELVVGGDDHRLGVDPDRGGELLRADASDGPGCAFGVSGAGDVLRVHTRHPCSAGVTRATPFRRFDPLDDEAVTEVLRCALALARVGGCELFGVPSATLHPGQHTALRPQAAVEEPGTQVGSP